ncbi:MAG: hypothetical protein IAE91_08640 [Ignavibacteriaceae bacterium]|nr:hypothetical protein [Ignavibacteriaceae bacterium]
MDLTSFTGKSPSKKKEYFDSDEIKNLAEKIIEEQHLDIKPAEVGYLIVSPYISKTIPSKTLKCSPELKHFSGLDYIIQISQELWLSLEPADKNVLLFHELMKIMPVMNDKTGEYDMRLRPPDMYGFSKVINQYGSEWRKRIVLCLSSLYNFSANQEDKVKI